MVADVPDGEFRLRDRPERLPRRYTLQARKTADALTDSSEPCPIASSSPSPTASPTCGSTAPTSATRSTTTCSLAIAEAGERLKTEPGVRAVVLSRRGRVVLRRSRLRVVPGDGRRRRPGRPASGRSGNPGAMEDGRITHLGQQVCWVWQEMPVPVIAAVHGHALGGGIQIALGADIRIVHPDTQLVGARGALGPRARHDRHVHAVAPRPRRRRQGARPTRRGCSPAPRRCSSGWRHA